MLRTAIRLFAVSAMLASACGSLAQTVLPLANPSFEDDAAQPGTFPVLVPAGWSLYDPAGIVNQNTNAVGVLRPQGTSFFVDPVPDGNNAALVYLEQRAGTTLPGDPVGLSASFAAVLQNDTRYELSVHVGNIASGTGLGSFAGLGFYDLSGFPGYRVELLAGTEVLAFDDNSLAATLAEGRFQPTTVVFTTGAAHAQAGSVLGVRLINLNATGNTAERGREVDFDQVQLLATAVPEPAAFAMWLGGLGLLLAGLRRRVPVGNA